MAALLAGLDGARLVRTAAFAALADLGEFVVTNREVLVVDGDVGVGKTTLVDDWVSTQRTPFGIIRVPPKQSSRDIVRMALAALTRGREADELTERDIQDDLVTLLAAPSIVIVRNAHRLSLEAAAQLEWLHSASGGHPLIIEGGPGTGAAVERDALLRGAVASTLTVQPLKGTDLLTTLRQMHLMFLGADADLLVEIDTRVCRGVLGHWARFLQVALHLRQRAVANGRDEPVLDRPFAKAVLARMPATLTKKRA